MKKFFLPFLLILAAASCEDELQAPSDGMPETVLLLDGWISSLDSLHTLKVAESSLSKGLIEAKDVKVSIYVNGVLKDESDSVVAHSSITSEFILKALLAPGDMVEVRAESPAGHASASSVIMPAPSVSNASYDGILRMSYYDYSNKREGTFELFRFDLHDSPGNRDVYRIGLFRTSDFVLLADDVDDEYPYPSSKPVGWTQHNPMQPYEAYNMLEPAMKIDWGRADYSNSNFTLFTDRFFDGDTYRVSVLSLPYVTPSYGYGGRETWAIREKAIVRVESVSEEAYRYYADVEYAKGGTSVIPMFYEPPILPSNVDGGIGFVCFASATELVCDLPEELIGWRAENPEEKD